MFVSRLDRPWRETPMEPEEFHIANQSEIEEIKEQTRNVYILVPDEEIEVASAPYGDGAAKDVPQHHENTPRRNRSDTKQELPAAKNSIREIANLVEEIEARLESDKKLDMPRVKQSIKRMVHGVGRNPDAYVWMTRITSYGAHGHRQSLSTAVWAVAFGHRLGLDEQSLNNVALGTLLMDAGLTKIPAEILRKTSRLAHDEWDIVKTHVRHSMDMLSNRSGFPPAVMGLIATHHERLDGSGYPSGLRDKDIPLLGQIAGIVDFYTAITQPRPFMKAVSPLAASQILYKQAGTYFNQNPVNGFIHTLSTYPTGSLVEMNTGEVGIVSSQNSGWLLRPNIVFLLNAEKKPYDSHPLVNLLEEMNNSRGQPLYIVRSVAEGEYDIDIELTRI